MKQSIQPQLVALREQVATAAALASTTARVYQRLRSEREAASLPPDSAVSEDARLQLESIRRRELLELGRAAALQWVLVRMDDLVAVLAKQEHDPAGTDCVDGEPGLLPSADDEP